MRSELFIAGILLVVGGAFELIDTSFEQLVGHELHAAHGVILFGLVQIVNAVAELIAGYEHIIEGLGSEERSTQLQGDTE